MNWFRSLRSQLIAGAALVVLVVVALAGAAIVFQLDARDRADLDDTLQQRASRVLADLDKMLDAGQQSSDDSYGELLNGSDSLVRLISDGTVVAERGEVPSGDLALPAGEGFATVAVDGIPWRSLVVVTGSPGLRLQVLQSLAPIEERLDATRLLVIVVTAIATIAAGFGGWLISAVILRPVQRLRDGARAIRADRDIEHRLPAVAGPQEVAELSATLNDMLDRLQASTLSTRRFTADAGHELRTPLTSIGIYLESLRRNPGLAASDRERILATMAGEHGRIVALLEGLQTLARGDTGALPSRQPVDVADLVDDAVRRARRRYAGVSFELHAEDAALLAWPEGMRLVIDNLLDNAALHGRPAGHVHVRVSASAGHCVVTIADDGPGVPSEERDRVVQRFVRGSGVRAEGSGLGLSLVVQQVALHGGTVTLGETDGGGLTVVLSFANQAGVGNYLTTSN